MNHDCWDGGAGCTRPGLFDCLGGILYGFCESEYCGGTCEPEGGLRLPTT